MKNRSEAQISRDRVATKERAGRFTLLELLAILVILAVVVAGFLLPATGRARHPATDMKCKVNLKGIGQALAVYTDQGIGPLPVDFRPLIDNDYLIDELIQCPVEGTPSSATGDADLGDYAYRVNTRCTSPRRPSGWSGITGKQKRT